MENTDNICGDPRVVEEFADLFLYSEKAQIDTAVQVQRYQAAANIELCKMREKAQIDAEKAERIAKIRADVASKREMQTFELLTSSDGDITVRKKIFEGEARGCLNAKLIRNVICRSQDDSENDEILFAEFHIRRGKKVSILVKTTESPKKVVEKFSRAGLAFGFRTVKERELLWKLFIHLLETDKVWKFPTKRGWNLKNGELSYIYPKDLLWQEVKEDAER